MRAAVQADYGAPPRVEEVPVPPVGDDEVLVAVEAAGVDRGTWHLAHGTPRLVRLAMGLRRPRVPVPGRDVAGRVAAVGSRVEDVAVGDRVLGTGRGTFAELAVVPRGRLAHAPAALTSAQAAALPVSGITAWQAVHTSGHVAAGQKVLVLGASGGVGTFAVQVARAAGAEVTGVCSAAKADLVRGLGAQHVVAYDEQGLSPDDGPFDLVLDIGGVRRVRDLRRLLTERGTLVLVGGEGGGAVTGGLGRQVRAALRSPFLRQRIVMLVADEKRENLEHLVRLVEEGTLVPAVGREFALEDAGEAIEHVGSGSARGKVVVRVSNGAR